MQDDEVSGTGEDDELPAPADAELEELEPAGFEAYLLKKYPEGLPTGVVSGLSKTLERASAQFAASSQISEALRNVSAWQDRLGESARIVAAFHENSAAAALASALAKNLRVLDQGMPGNLLLRERSITADWARLALGPSALTSWRTALEAQAHLLQIRTPPADVQLIRAPLFEDLKRIVEGQVRLTDWVVSQDATSPLLGEVSGRPLGLWRDHVERLSASSGLSVLQASVAAGSAGLGLLGADVLESGAPDGELVQVTVERVEVDVLAPSERARLRAAKELYMRLGAIDPTTPELLDGAWDDVERNGPAAATKAAHCIEEVLDRTLRAAATETAVLEWHTRTDRSRSEFGDRGQITRSLRVKYLASQIGGTQELVVAQYESLTKLLTPLVRRLQGVKHASTADMLLVRSLLQTAEGFLAVLFSLEMS